MKNKYFYTVIGIKDQQENLDYIYKRVTSSENLAGHNVISANIFSTKTEAEKVARFWNYCSLQNGNSYEETICEPKFSNRGATLILRIGYDIRAEFNLQDIAKRFFDYYETVNATAEELSELISEYLYEATRDIGLLEIIKEYKCYEGLEFDFDAYNRSHNDFIFNGLIEYLKEHIMNANIINKYWGVA